jgi:putative membrane protein
MNAQVLVCGYCFFAGVFLGSAAWGQDLQAFADRAASANRFEIETSELAIGSAKDGDVRAFAELMITDHTAAAEKMGAAAEADGITPEAEISEMQQARLNELESLTGERFDTAYIDVQATAHDEAIALFRAFAEGEEESALRDFAQQALPVLEQHQEHLRTLATE